MCVTSFTASGPAKRSKTCSTRAPSKSRMQAIDFAHVSTKRSAWLRGVPFHRDSVENEHAEPLPRLDPVSIGWHDEEGIGSGVGGKVGGAAGRDRLDAGGIGLESEDAWKIGGATRVLVHRGIQKRQHPLSYRFQIALHLS